MASRLFGAHVQPSHVIGETLERATESGEVSTDSLLDAVRSPRAYSASDYDDFTRDPLARWLESVIGLAERDGVLVRADPRQIGGTLGIAAELASLTGIESETAIEAIRRTLLAGATVVDPNTGFPVFAFRLHQFVSRGSNVFATPEPPELRYVTLTEQQFAPGNREKRLLPLAFCRQCGQDYYLVERTSTSDGEYAVPRDLGDRDRTGTDGDESEGGTARQLGFLFVSDANSWPFNDPEEVNERIPFDWLEETRSGDLRVDPRQRHRLLQRVWIQPNARISTHPDEDAMQAAWFPIDFRFCLNCGVAYSPMTRSDISKLSTLGFEGRSTSTTMLVLSVLRHLTDEHEDTVERKLLNFTDNRQDASLQAGHFNDFVQVSLLRSGLFKALQQAGTEGLDYTTLAGLVFAALGLPLAEYAQNPDAKRGAKDEIDRALREVLAYRLYGDLKTGWRITAPNLEQVGLLQFDYPDLADLCSTEEDWRECHEALVEATPSEREDLCRAILDWLRHELAIQVDALDANHHEQLWQRSDVNLIAPWTIDENERYQMTKGSVVWLTHRQANDPQNWLYITPRTSVGQHISRRAFADHRGMKRDDVELIAEQVFKQLSDNGSLKKVDEREIDDRDGGKKTIIGYQIPASAIRWKAGNGTTPARDRIRVPRAPNEQAAINEFFVDFYQTVASSLVTLEAREHTARSRPKSVRRERTTFARTGFRCSSAHRRWNSALTSPA